VAGKVYSTTTLTRNVALIDLSSIPLRQLGISRKDLIESGGVQYPKTRLWALALYDQHPKVSHGHRARQIRPEQWCFLEIVSPSLFWR
jgi:hypothetical protein